MRTLIVGGGMAGMAAAIAAAERGDAVTVLERNAKSLKKLGVAGNGRGNLLNAGSPMYYGDPAFAMRVLESLPYAKLAAFWESIGVPLRIDVEGRVYPTALLASVAVDALRLRAAQLGIEVRCRTKVTRLSCENGVFIAETTEEIPPNLPQGKKYEKKGKQKAPDAMFRECRFTADRVIVTAGGAAAPAHGTDGTAYGLLTGFGHTLHTPKPALCAICTDKKTIQGLAGQRARAALRLTHVTLPEYMAEGEILFAEDGISGIAAMELARFVDSGSVLHVDFRPAIGKENQSESAIVKWLMSLAKSRLDLPIAELLTGAMAAPLSRAILSAAAVSKRERPIRELPATRFDTIAKILTDFPLPVAHVRGFENAQVTAGGIAASEFDPATMESRLMPGLLAAGEVLDVDGACGGFNLMFALASGLLAGDPSCAAQPALL